MTGASLEIRSVLVSSSYHKSYYNTTAVQACCRWGAAVYVRYVLCKHYTSIYILLVTVTWCIRILHVALRARAPAPPRLELPDRF